MADPAPGWWNFTFPGFKVEGDTAAKRITILRRDRYTTAGPSWS